MDNPHKLITAGNDKSPKKEPKKGSDADTDTNIEGEELDSPLNMNLIDFSQETQENKKILVYLITFMIDRPQLEKTLNDYNFKKPESTNNVGVCGHFTQVVWKDTKEVGFGGALSKKGKWYAVGNYYPAGNVLNDFGKNVIKI